MAPQLRRWGRSTALGAATLWVVVAACASGLFARVAGAASAPDSSAAIVADMVRSVEFATQRCGTADLSPDGQAAFERNRPRFEASLERSLAFARAAETAETLPELLTVARARGRAGDVFGADLGDESTTVASLRFLLEMHESFFEKRLRARLPADSLRAFEARLNRFRREDLEAAQKRTLERIHHFEIKYGPGSSKLNALETLLNFGAQRVWPFKPGANGVSPLEVVASYSTSYGTVVEGEATAISAVDFGVRIYNWAYRDEPSSLAQAAVPRYWTLALAVGAREDGPLEWPWQKKPRLGPLVSWGEFKLAYLFAKADDWRLVVSRQVQLLPHLF